MTLTTEKADDIDAFDALESEEKEFIKVMFSFPSVKVISLITPDS
jgi:hypothetical protein